MELIRHIHQLAEQPELGAAPTPPGRPSFDLKPSGYIGPPANEERLGSDGREIDAWSFVKVE